MARRFSFVKEFKIQETLAHVYSAFWWRREEGTTLSREQRLSASFRLESKFSSLRDQFHIYFSTWYLFSLRCQHSASQVIGKMMGDGHSDLRTRSLYLPRIFKIAPLRTLSKRTRLVLSIPIGWSPPPFPPTATKRPKLQLQSKQWDRIWTVG